jgi:drug/metabolite transporter (DMT)-like permease
LNPIFGELAALSTALCWAFGSTFFTISGSRIGSANVNRGRLVAAGVLLCASHLILTGRLLPFDASLDRWVWLGLSGLVGFIIGDGMLFEAFVLIGPRLSMLMMSLVPIISALFAWIFMGEKLKPVEILAILMTLAGIFWVIAEKNRSSQSQHGKKLILGIFMGIGGALGQAFGLILSKKGLEGGFPALSGNVIRVTIAAIAIWLLALFSGKARSTILSFRDKKASWALTGGAFFGPFIGVWLSLISIKYARLAIATTFMSVTPIFLIPISRIVFGEKVTIGSIIGTIIAVAGVAILLLV